MTLSKKSISLVGGITALILLIPFIGMQISNEVNWTLSDFVIGGVILFTFGLIVAFAAQNIRKRTTRLVVIGIILLILLLVWGELAVGIFGTPFAGS
jgi:hypothetical protein